MTCTRLMLAAVGSVALTAATLTVATPARADDASARRVLKSMTDYLSAQKNLSTQVEIDLDVVTPAIEQIQFSASGELELSRPNRLHARRKGGYAEVELISDGQTVTIVDRYRNQYAQIKDPASSDQLIDKLRSQYYMDLPAADLFLSRSYDELMTDVLEAKHIGIGVVDGQDCEHLAFRKADTDWQLWVRTGDRPVPCKYKITSKTVASAPSYTIRFHDWKVTDPGAAAFSFKPAPGAKSVAFEALSNIGELPSPTPLGEGSGP